MIYEYLCRECGDRHEELVGTVAEGDRLGRRACSKCGKRKLRRTVTAPQLHIRYSQLHPRHMRGQRGR